MGGIQEQLNSILNKYTVQKGKLYTNTSIGHPKKSLYIPDDEYEEFLRIYSLAITNGIHLYFTEKPNNPSPLRVDLDFRFLLMKIFKILLIIIIILLLNILIFLMNII